VSVRQRAVDLLYAMCDRVMCECSVYVVDVLDGA